MRREVADVAVGREQGGRGRDAGTHGCVEIRNNAAAAKVGYMLFAIDGVGHVADVQLMLFRQLVGDIRIGVGKDDVRHTNPP